MRLRRLDLACYGKFTNATLDFGDAPSSGPDLHIVYGPNEAGKSTAFNAYLDVLFGIEHNTKYNFLHSNDALRIGAALDFDNRVVDVVRVKKGKPRTLLNPDGAPLPAGILLDALPVADRAHYKALFSLDDDTLEHGGEDILRSKGDWGRALFQASSGLARIDEALGSLTAAADAIYRPRAQKTRLAVLKEELIALDKQIKAQDLAYPAYEAQLNASENADAAYTTAEQTRRRAVARLNALDAAVKAHPIRARLKTLQEKIAPLAAYPVIPGDWPDQAQKMAVDRAAAAAREAAAQDDAARIRVELEALALDPEGAALADAVTALEELAATDAAHAVDRPRLDADRRRIDADITTLAAEIGIQPETDGAQTAPPENAPEGALAIDRIQLSDTQIQDLADRLAARATLLTAQQAAEDALKRAKAACAAAEADAPRPTTDPAPLEAALTRLRVRDPWRGLTDSRAALAVAEARAAAALDALAPWRGDPKTLFAVALSQDQANLWRDQALDAAKALDSVATDIRYHTENLRKVDAALGELTTSVGDVSDQAAAAARANRNAAWRAHRAALTADTADAFAQALADDDAVGASRLAAADQLAEWRGLEKERRQINHDVGILEARRHDIAAAQEARAAARAPVFVAAGLPADLDPLALPDWLTRREAAMAALTAAAEACAAVVAAETAVAEAAADLRRASPGAPVSDDFNRLWDQAEADLARLKTQAAAATAADGRRTAAQNDYTERQDDAAARAADLARWSDSWRETYAGTWAEARAPEAVTAALGPLRALNARMAERTTIADAIAQMAATQSRFASEVARLTPLNPDAQSAFRTLRQRVAAACAAAETATGLRRRLKAAEDRARAAAADHAALDARQTEMKAVFADDLLADGLTEALRRAQQRATLEAQIAAVEADLAGVSAGATVGATVDENLAHNAPSPASLEDLRHALEDARAAATAAEADRDACLQARVRAQEALAAAPTGAETIAALAQKRRVLELQIHDQTATYLRLRLGMLAADHALNCYRQERRGAMLAAARDAFVAITMNEFNDLTAEPYNGRDVLTARRTATGAALQAGDMSKGTRFALYLALRIAGWREMTRPGPPPIVADDILETFDNHRAAKAFQQLAGAALWGQVIYLTHHEHLLDVAQEACNGQARLHTL